MSSSTEPTIQQRLEQGKDSWNTWRGEVISPDFRGTNSLNGMDLSGYNLDGAIFDGVNLEGVNFTDASLNNASFKLAILKDADFTEAKLKNANFQEAEINNAKFIGADITGSDFKGAKNQKNANFQDAIGKFTLPEVHCWDYYLTIEDDLIQVSRYIEIGEANYKTYSMKLA